MTGDRIAITVSTWEGRVESLWVAMCTMCSTGLMVVARFSKSKVISQRSSESSHKPLGVPGLRLLAYCLMPNHWHLVCWPRQDGELSDFAHYLTLTHTQRWHAHYHNVGTGHLYQGRFKAFPVAGNDHYLQLCRYVERNALRARLVKKAEDWRWGSLWHRQQAEHEVKLLTDGPVALPETWLAVVNQPQ